MNFTNITNLITTTLTNFGTEVLVVLTAVIASSAAYFLFKFVMRFFQGTTVFGWAWLDRMTYKPYKGYNRLRSRKWNLEHTADNTGMGYRRMEDGFVIKI